MSDAMSFSQAVRTSLTRCATFSGRSRRAEYWWFSVFFVAGAAVVIGVSIAARLPLLNVLVAPLIPPMMAVSIRRLHDTGRSGPWMLVALIPVVGPLIYLYLMTIDSHPTPNTYGTAPR